MKIQMVLALAAWVINSTTIMAQETIKQTAGRDQLGDLLLNSRNLMMMQLFGEVWERTDKLGLPQSWLLSLHLSVRVLPTVHDLSLADRQAERHHPVRESRKLLRTLPFYADGRKRLRPRKCGRRCSRRRGKGSFQREMIFPIEN